MEDIKITMKLEKNEHELVKADFQQKLRTLRAFEEALREADKHFYLRLMNDETVEIIDLLSGSKRYVNIACDNAAPMMYDIFRQAGDWIL